jgi:hypothetical protein
MVLDPVTAVGLAGNIVQFIELSGNVISKSHEIYKSSSGAVRDIIELERLTQAVIALDSQICGTIRPPGTLSALTKEQQQLEDVRAHCMDIASELMKALKELKISDAPKKWKSFRKALRTVWEKKKIESIEMRLAACKNQLTMHAIIDMR